MSESKDGKQLAVRSIDLGVSAYKSIVGVLPIVGPLLSELAAVIPGQRIDRIAVFAQTLEKRLSELEEEVRRVALENEQFSALLEEALEQVVRPVSDERRTQVAELVANGITDGQGDKVGSRYLLGIIGQLNDIEIVWLRFYLDPRMNGDQVFREKHKAILEVPRAHIGATGDVVRADALRNSYQEHLANLGLIKPVYKGAGDLSVIDKFGNGPEVSSYRITNLGRILLNEIGIHAPPRKATS